MVCIDSVSYTHLDVYKRQHNKWQRNITFYKRYVDDTFVTFVGTTRQANMLLHYMNNIAKNIQFTLEIESNNAINFLDLTFMKHNNKLQYRIYRKPTDVYKRQFI